MKQLDKVVLSAKDAVKNYGELEVLKGINLDIHQGEVVVIPVNPDLLDYDKPYVFNKKNESETKTSLGYCIVANPEIKFQFIPITYEPALAGKKDYSVAITQSSAEVAEFKNFFKKGL